MFSCLFRPGTKGIPNPHHSQPRTITVTQLSSVEIHCLFTGHSLYGRSQKQNSVQVMSWPEHSCAENHFLVACGGQNICAAMDILLVSTSSLTTTCPPFPTGILVELAPYPNTGPVNLSPLTVHIW